MKSLIALALLVSAASAFFGDELFRAEWNGWKLAHGKIYSSAREEGFRMKIFMENRLKIAKHNEKANRGEATYTMRMNKFGDMLFSEFKATMNGYRSDLRQKSQKGATFIAPANVELPTMVDWRTHGAVTDVKDQGNCGSCWAFSTTGSLEGQHFRKTGKLVSLSEQNLIDCSAKFGNEGCNGGLMDSAFKYIKANGGIDTENSYPYHAVDQPCHFMNASIGADDTGFVDIKSGDEDALAAAVATIGPVSVAIDAEASFQFYDEGIYNNPGCSTTELDHGVLAVGYGDGYWLVKNSWGDSWGMKGYIKMTKDGTNQCGIATEASYPLV